MTVKKKNRTETSILRCSFQIQFSCTKNVINDHFETNRKKNFVKLVMISCSTCYTLIHKLTLVTFAMRSFNCSKYFTLVHFHTHQKSPMQPNRTEPNRTGDVMRIAKIEYHSMQNTHWCTAQCSLNWKRIIVTVKSTARARFARKMQFFSILSISAK